MERLEREVEGKEELEREVESREEDVQESDAPLSASSTVVRCLVLTGPNGARRR